MTTNLRYVIDTSVIVSALLRPNSVPRQALDLAFERGLVLVSEETLNELSQVLRRPKFDRYVTQQERQRFLATFAQDATLADVTVVITDCRDPKDNKFLELAISACAVAIVSGDDDLLMLDPYRGVSIWTPQAFVDSQFS